jgi:hypothetical protein
MLRPITTSSASASSAPVAVRASAAADPAASESRASTMTTANSAQSQQGGAIKADEMFRYNSYQFVYRQDVGRIVLVGQSPETGERVIQVPSEQVLRAYARIARIEKQVAPSRTDKSPESAPTPQGSSQVSKALVAAVSGDNHGSGVISVSA